MVSPRQIFVRSEQGEEMGGECGVQRENRNACRVLVGKLGRKRTRARAVRKLEGNTVIPRLTSDSANEFFD